MRLQTTVALLSAIFHSARADYSNQSASEWSGWGANYYNNRWASSNSQLSSSNIQSLTSHCKISYPTGVSATPVTSGSVAFYPTWDGSFVALDYTSCKVLWELNVTEVITNFAPLSDLQRTEIKPVSRTSPQISGNVLYFGTLTHALLVAADKSTGKVLDTIQINDHPFAIVTMSPTLFDNKIFVGTASVEESISVNPDYKCCSFVGNMAAVSFDASASKFSILWSTPMIPQAQSALGWSGVAVWGSQPSIDTVRRQVFIATGNTYGIPDIIASCQNETQSIPAVKQGLVPDPCLPDDILQESVIAIDIDLGIINWVHQLPALDSWTIACGYGSFFPTNKTLCPQTPGPDADFGMAPAYVPGSKSTPFGKDVVVVGQKSGILYAFSAQAGRLFWATAVGPGGIAGGLSWGVAADDEMVYFTAINADQKTWSLQPSNLTTNRSAYGAVSLDTGTILWETVVPDNGISWAPPGVVGDLVLVGKTGVDPNGTGDYDKTNGSLVALEKGSGRVVLETVQDTNMHGGVAVQGDYVMFGLGYRTDGAKPAVPGSFNVLKVG